MVGWTQPDGIEIFLLVPKPTECGLAVAVVGQKALQVPN